MLVIASVLKALAILALARYISLRLAKAMNKTSSYK